MGGGGGAAEAQSYGVPAATEAPAAPEAPAAEAPSVQMAPLGTATAPALEDTTARAMETEVLKNGEASNAAGTGLEQQPAQPPSVAPVVSSVWQWLFAGIALISAFIMAMMRQLSINRWRKK